MDFFAHDLVRINIRRLPLSCERPAWVLPSLREHPWAVVRRAVADDAAHLPIGVRGSDRSKRFAATMPIDLVLERVTPEMLAARITDDLQASPIAAIVNLARVKDLLADYRWGPVGSVGFFLATGADCVSTASDLDIILRCESIPAIQTAIALVHALQSQTSKVDVLIETPAGGVSLQEYISSAGQVILRTPNGPRLIEVSR